MQGKKSHITKGLQAGSTLKCADNTGARLIQIMSVRGYKGVKGRSPRAGVGDPISVHVIEGTEKMRHEMLKAVIIRQKKEFRRPDGTRLKFDDNAAVIIEMAGKKEVPKGTEIKGPVAKEAIERFPPIGKIASIVI